MAALNIRQIALVIGIAIALSVLYFKTQTVDIDRHERTQKTLRDLKHWDGILKQDILRARTGLLNHYDTLVSTMKALGAAHALLAGGATAVPKEVADDGLKQSLRALGKSLEERALNLERFKSRNAILKNSMSYLPVAVGRLALDIRRDPGRAA